MENEEVIIISRPSTNYNPTQADDFLDPKEPREVPSSSKGPNSRPQSYSDKEKENLPQVPVGGANQKVKYYHSHNNRGTFDENGNNNGNEIKSTEPEIVGKDYPEFDDLGRMRYVENWEKKKNRTNLPTKEKEKQQVENRPRQSRR